MGVPATAFHQVSDGRICVHSHVPPARAVWHYIFVSTGAGHHGKVTIDRWGVTIVSLLIVFCLSFRSSVCLFIFCCLTLLFIDKNHTIFNMKVDWGNIFYFTKEKTEACIIFTYRWDRMGKYFLSMVIRNLKIIDIINITFIQGSLS